jgi:defect-in-organelle-trafficking protein DotB
MSEQNTNLQTSENPFATSAGTEIYRYVGKLTNQEFDRILAWAAKQSASDVTFQPGIPIMAEIAGKWRAITKQVVSVADAQSVFRYIYNDTAINSLSQGKDLDFAYEFKHPMYDAEKNIWEAGYENQPIRLRFRVNVTSGRSPGGGVGASATFRALPTQPIEISKLNLEPEITKYFRPEQGLNLICGPTGSGKSTLLSSLVRWLCEKPDANEKVIEFSSPIEYVYDDLKFPSSFVWQTGAGTHLINHDERSEGGIWNHCIRNALRRKPSIIILGESRDRHTIEGCVQAALSGHLTVSTLHTIGVPETFRRLVMPFPAAERATISIDLLQVLNLVVTQLLCRRVGGGKVGVREFLVFDAGVRRALEDRDPNDWPKMIRKMLSTGETHLKHKVVGQGMDVAARRLHEKGIISYDDMKHISARAEIERGSTE